MPDISRLPLDLKHWAQALGPWQLQGDDGMMLKEVIELYWTGVLNLRLSEVICLSSHLPKMTSNSCNSLECVIMCPKPLKLVSTISWHSKQRWVSGKSKARKPALSFPKNRIPSDTPKAHGLSINQSIHPSVDPPIHPSTSPWQCSVYCNWIRIRAEYNRFRTRHDKTIVGSFRTFGFVWK